MSEWISVKDRLPEYGDLIIVVIDRKVVNRICFRDGSDDSQDWVEAVGENDNWTKWFSSVTHWMPLPESPA